MSTTALDQSAYVIFLCDAVRLAQQALGESPICKNNNYLKELSKYQTILEWRLKGLISRMTMDQRRNLLGQLSNLTDSSPLDTQFFMINYLIQARIYI